MKRTTKPPQRQDIWWKCLQGKKQHKKIIPYIKIFQHRGIHLQSPWLWHEDNLQYPPSINSLQNYNLCCVIRLGDLTFSPFIHAFIRRHIVMATTGTDTSIFQNKTVCIRGSRCAGKTSSCEGKPVTISINAAVTVMLCWCRCVPILEFFPSDSIWTEQKQSVCVKI